MIWDSDTVFVLAAGFTRAFLPKSPLLIDEYYGEALKERFSGFRWARALLESELQNPDHSPGWINLERLMTRLAGGMPYDDRTGEEKSLALLLAELQKSFLQRLRYAKRDAPNFLGELWLFAGHCIKKGNVCITFNYDDVLDKALWQYASYLGPYPDAWNPDRGYGFPCRSAVSLVGNRLIMQHENPNAVRLLKLHGSMNWYVPYGHPKPYGVEAIRHHEDWTESCDAPTLTPGEIVLLLEPEPFIIPPLLTKADNIEQPIVRTLWHLAIEGLEKAQRVVFIGYSLPLTDIASGFLFREGLSRLKPDESITVVDYAKDESQRTEKLPNLLTSYSKSFPGIKPEQFHFTGAAEWIRDNLTEWLYDSHGNPVAFNANEHIVSRSGRFIGTIREYSPNRRQIWHGRCKGEIVQGNRFLCGDPPPTEDRGGSHPPPLPNTPSVPKPIHRIELPPGYRDIDWQDEAWLYAKPAGLLDPSAA